jgi:choice-of-anchor C domain-containing protein
VAKRNEGPAAAAARRPFPWGWLAAALLLTATAAGLALCARHRPEAPRPVQVAAATVAPQSALATDALRSFPARPEMPPTPVVEPTPAVTPPPALTPVPVLPVMPPPAPTPAPVAPPPPPPPAPAPEPVPPAVQEEEVPEGNLLVNGSFEEGPADEGGDAIVALDAGSTAIPGWTVIRGQIDHISTFWTAADGGRSLDLNGSPGCGGVAQTFATKPGQRYRVTFALAGNPTGDVKGLHLAVSAAGATQEFDFDCTGMSQDDMGWQEMTWEFVAVADQTTLELYSTDMTDPIRGPALDNVSVVAVR